MPWNVTTPDADRRDGPPSVFVRSLASALEVVDLTGDAVAAVGLLGAGRLARSLGLADPPQPTPPPVTLRVVRTFDPGPRRAHPPR